MGHWFAYIERAFAVGEKKKVRAGIYENVALEIFDSRVAVKA